jgi:hypothetical protein
MTKFGDVLTTDEVPTGGTTILNGTGPPADALGAVGNYYLDTTAKILYGPKSATQVYGSDSSVFTIAPTAMHNIGASSCEGSRITVAAAGRITGLRYYRYGGNASAHNITLCLYLQSTQAELGRTVINNAASAPAGWVVGTLSTPVAVSGSTAYRTASTSSAAINSSYQQVTPTSGSSLLAYLGGCWTMAPTSYPATDDTPGCYFVDLVFQPLTQWPVALKSAP